MGYTLADEEVARQKLRLTSSTMSLNNYLTVWKGVPAIIELNTLSYEINKVYYPGDLPEEDMECLTSLVRAYKPEFTEEDEDGEGN